MLRVLLARAWTIQDTQIRGSLPVAFVASGEIVVKGLVDASARGSVFGSGALPCGVAGGGGSTGGVFFLPPSNASGGYPPHLWGSNGFGGGGFGTAGGSGGATSVTVMSGVMVGAAGVVNGNPALVPLRGGCEGGAYAATQWGAGGGAMQFVAGRAFHLDATGPSKGVLSVGGGHGIAGGLGVFDVLNHDPIWGPTGGGSGGGILIESPSVVIDNGSKVLAGGGWGACATAPDGLDADASTAIARGGACSAPTFPRAAGGDGAIAGAGSPGEDDPNGASGGGGGGLGRIRINTADGQYSAGPGTVVRGEVAAGLIGRR